MEYTCYFCDKTHTVKSIPQLTDPHVFCCKDCANALVQFGIMKPKDFAFAGRSFPVCNKQHHQPSRKGTRQ